MIDEYYTFKIYGYYSYDLSDGSNKRVVAVCDNCGKYRSLVMNKHSDICGSCSQIGRKHTEESKQKMAAQKIGNTASDETKQKMSKSQTGRRHPEETKRKISESLNGHDVSDETKQKLKDAWKNRLPVSDETRQRMSATRQNVSYEEWEEYVDGKRSYLMPIRDCKKVNGWFVGAHAHHMTPTIVVYIPAELHNHIPHNLQTGLNMGEMNVVAIQFINGGLDVMDGNV